MRGWEIFEVSLHGWWMDANFPILWRTSYFACLRPPLSNFIQPIPPLPCHLQPLTPLFFCFPFSLAEWVIMPHQMLSLGTVVPEGPWCMFYATRHHVCQGLIHNVVFYCTLIWYHTHKHTAHSGASRLTHLCKYIFAPPIMCPQLLPSLH